jgi:hypothetical protein
MRSALFGSMDRVLVAVVALLSGMSCFLSYSRLFETFGSGLEHGGDGHLGRDITDGIHLQPSRRMFKRSLQPSMWQRQKRSSR